MAQQTIPSFTPIQLLSFLSQTRESLPDDSEFSELITVLLTPRYMIPTVKFVANAVPYFQRASDPSLEITFRSIISATDADPNFEAMFTRILESFYLLDKVSDVLGSQKLLEEYMVALKMEDPSASHQEVMRSLNNFMDTKLDAVTRGSLQRVFLETEVSAELGITDSSLYDLYSVLSSQPQLYLDVLTALKLNSQKNMPWDAVEVKVHQIVNAQQPHLWDVVSGVLDEMQRSRGYSADPYAPQDGTVYYNVGYTYQDYVQQRQAESNSSQNKFNNMNVTDSNRGVTG